MTNNQPEWRPVPTHPGYFANARGQLLGPRGRVLKPMAAQKGHLYVLVPPPRRPRKLFVHRAVLLAHVGPPNDPAMECRHLDGNPGNNSLSNLAWGTKVENMRDKARHGTERRGEAKPGARLTVDEAHAIREDSRSSRTVAAAYGVSHTTVISIRRGLLWRGL